MGTRLALSAWIGAATLFVIDGVRLVTADVFGSVERDHIALIRFPPYYLTGATCLAFAIGGMMLARTLPGMNRRRWTAVLVLILLASAAMLVDYVWVYSPLAQMITPPGIARPAGFRTLHRASEIVNTIQIGLCLAAACVSNWPLDRPS
ncbi:MAG: hypothetical protein AB7I48_01050 [Planctomycetaceae bacterium]